MQTTMDMETLNTVREALILLGNYIGNKWDGGGGIKPFDRCALIEAINNAFPINEE